MYQYNPDDDYLADLELSVLGREVPDSAVALGVAALAGAWWWLGRKPAAAAALSGLPLRCTKYRVYNGKRRCVSYLPQGSRRDRKIRCAKYRTYRGKRHCVRRKYV